MWSPLAPLAIAVLMAAAAAGAQPAAAPAAETGAIVGVVRDDGERPVEGARVRDARTGRIGLTDGEGRFHLRGLPVGRRLVDVMAIGHGMATGEVEVRAGLSAELVVRLPALPSLDTVVVTEAAPGDAPRELLDHLRDGTATRIFTAAEIAQRAPVYTSRLLALLPGVRVVGDGPRASVVAGRGSSPGCTRVFLDGYPVRNDEVNTLPPSMLAGVEFYHAANAPPQYLRGGACAVVLLWTKVRRPPGKR